MKKNNVTCIHAETSLDVSMLDLHCLKSEGQNKVKIDKTYLTRQDE